MSLHDAGVIAGTVSTALFVSSYLPMLVTAARTRDLRFYRPGHLVIAIVGNLVHTVYLLSLPPRPVWLLHTFYLLSSAVMLLWWWRYRTTIGPRPSEVPPAAAAPRATPPEDPAPEPGALVATQ